jgi:hypothetical protein
MYIKTKKCSICKEEKSVSEFYPRYGKHGTPYQSHCKICHVKETTSYRNSPKGSRIHKNRTLLTKFKISLGEYENLFLQQNSACALCKQSPENSKLAVDHKHGHHGNPKIGCRECIRGLLCKPCNIGFLPVAEKYPHLQTEEVQKYLKQRPFFDVRDKTIHGVIETESVVSE